MDNLSQRIAHLSPAKQSLVIVQLQARLDALEQQKAEPIAIIGIGCRFPGGATDTRSFWRLLRDGIDAITEVEPARWDWRTFSEAGPLTPGKANARWGGFLKDIDRFDAQAFGLSPREAERLDPQQRLLMEVTWEALEDGAVSRTVPWLNDRRVHRLLDERSWPAPVERSVSPRSLRRSRQLSQYGCEPALLLVRFPRPQHGD